METGSWSCFPPHPRSLAHSLTLSSFGISLSLCQCLSWDSINALLPLSLSVGLTLPQRSISWYQGRHSHGNVPYAIVRTHFEFTWTSKDFHIIPGHHAFVDVIWQYLSKMFPVAVFGFARFPSRMEERRKEGWFLSGRISHSAASICCKQGGGLTNQLPICPVLMCRGWIITKNSWQQFKSFQSDPLFLSLYRKY